MELITLPIVKPGVMTEMDSFIFECFGYVVIEEALDAAKRLHAGKL